MREKMGMKERKSFSIKTGKILKKKTIERELTESIFLENLNKESFMRVFVGKLRKFFSNKEAFALRQ